MEGLPGSRPTSVQLRTGSRVSVKDVSSSPLSSPRGSSAAPISGPLAVRAVQSSASSPRFSQASPRTPRSNDVSPREPATPAERMARKLDQLTSELLQSERSYLKDVELLIQIYLEPLRRSAKSPRGAVDEEDVSDMLPQSDVNGIFSNVEQVLGVNRALLEALEKDRSVGNVAAAFTQMADYLKVYSIYCSNQDTSLKLVEDSEKRVPAFKKWTMANQSKFLSRGLDLRDFLIKPTQRICKYPLFLRELIDNTPPDAETHRELLEVNDKIQAVVLHINEQRRLKVGLEGVREVYQRLSNSDYPLIKSQRVLVRKGAGPLLEVALSSSALSLTGSSGSLTGGSSPVTKGDDKARSGILGSFKRVSRRGSKLDSATLSPSGSPSTTRTSASLIEPPDLLREVYLFVFNDLFLMCRPCRAMGKKDKLDIFLEVAPDRVRAKPGNLADSFALRLLRDAGPDDKPTHYLFQCKDGLELDAWLEALEKLNPFAALSAKYQGRDPVGMCIAAEVDKMNARQPAIEQQLLLLSERLKASEMKKQKLDKADESTEEILRRTVALWYTMPQWKYQARELLRLCESFANWLAILEPHSKYSRKLQHRTESDGVALVSLRKHQQMLKDQKKEREDESDGGTPPPLPPRCDADYDEYEEVQEEYEEEDLDLDKLSSLLKSMSPREPEGGRNPAEASGGPTPGKKKMRWVKRKVRRNRPATPLLDGVAPPPMALPPVGEVPQTLLRVVNLEPVGGSRGGSLPGSPSGSRKKGPGLKGPPPAAPAAAAPFTPDYPHEDVSELVRDQQKKMKELVGKTKELYDAYKQLKKDLHVKVGALTQLVEALK